MQYLDALEGLRSQGYPNEEVTVRRYEIIQRFIEGVRNFELKRNLALMYAPEQYVEAPPTVEAIRFTIQQYLRMRGSARSDNYPMIPPPQQQANLPQPNQSPAAPLPAQKMQQQQPPPNQRHTNNNLRHRQPTDSNPNERASIAEIRRTSWWTAP